MNLKNYTSTVPASTSISRIEKNLVEFGASDISKKYENGICIAISFRAMEGAMPIFFKIPAEVNECFKVLMEDVKRANATTTQTKRQQAERTAWKIVSDWVEIQLTMLVLKQAKMMQLLLPYVYDPAKDETFFEKLEGSGFKLLTN